MSGTLRIRDTLSGGVKKFEKKYKDVNPGAMAKVGLQLLNNILNGSPAASVVPPIKDGVLRSSGSVFVGSVLVGKAPLVSSNATPLEDLTANDNVISIVFNTDYAARMHEDTWNSGPVSQQSGDVGNKFIITHLKADMPELMRFYSRLLAKDVFTGGVKE